MSKFKFSKLHKQSLKDTGDWDKDILETKWAIEQEIEFIESYCNRDVFSKDELLVKLRDLIRGHIKAQRGDYD
jgi:transcriptional antiterminator